MHSLFEELENKLSKHNKTYKDINFISYNGYEIDKDDFKKLAEERKYDQFDFEIKEGIVLHGNDFLMKLLANTEIVWFYFDLTKPKVKRKLTTLDEYDLNFILKKYRKNDRGDKK